MMKKKLAVIWFLFFWINSYSQTNYYVATTGSDANTVIQAQNPGTPWRTIRKASSTVVGNSIINVGAGTFNEPLQLIFAPLVSITGVDSIQTKVVLTFYDSSTHNGCIKFESSALNPVNGNQFIRNMWLDGSNLRAYSCLLVKARSNVEASGLRITNFRAFGAHFNGSTVPLGTVPSFWSTGNSFINSTITNCGDRAKVGGSCILIAAQDSILIDNCQFDNRYRPQGQNGNTMNMVSGNNKRVKIYNSRFYKPINEGATPNYCIESWRELGGYEVWRCYFNGGGNQVDAGTGGARKGLYAYSWWVHENTFEMASQLPVSPGTYSIGFQFEDSVSDTKIEYNHFKKLGMGIVISNTHGPMVTQRHTINNNLFENMGIADGSYAGWGGIYILISPQSPFPTGAMGRDINIYNNTIKANGGRSGLFLAVGSGCFIRNVTFTNNIVTGVTSYGYMTFAGSGTTYGGSNTANGIDSVVSKNNISWLNSFTNNAFYVAPQTSSTIYHFVTTINGTTPNPIKQDPLFVSATDFHLQATSPGATGNSPGGLNPPNTYIGRYPAGGALIAPTITWNPTTPYVYGNGVSAAQLNATSGGVPGTFSYDYSIGQLLNAGSYSFTVVFTPTDGATYSTVSKTVTVVVDKKPETLSYSGMTAVFNNTPQSPTVTTSPDAGLTVINTTLNGLGGGQTNVGSYAAVSGLTSSNYVATPINGTFTITPKQGTITVSNLSQIYDGSGKTVSVTTSDPFATVTTYDGSGSPSVSAGNHTVITSNTNTNYNVKADTSILVISQATPTLTSWTPTTPITYNAAIGASQLNAVWSVAGNTTYTPISGTIPNAGSLTITGDFIPSNSNYKSVLGTTRTITVNKGVTAIAVSDTVQYFDGSVKNITAIAGQSGTVTVNYTGAHTAVGDYPFTASFASANWSAPDVSGTLHILSNSATVFITNYSNRVYTGLPIDVTVTSPYSYSLVYSPSGHTDVGSYQVIATINDGLHTGADTVTMTIIKADPDKLWGTPADISYGTLLSGVQLNAFSSIPGVWSYSSPIGTLLPVGSTPVTATFTPTDLANYNIVTITVNITVTQASASMAFQTTTFTYDGTAKSVQVITNPVNLTGVAIVGSPQTNAGTYPISATMSNTNYQASPISATFTISKSNNYTLSWSIPAQITYPAPLTLLQLNPASTISGTFTFNYPLGTILNPGTTNLVATFHPSNTNYNTKTISVSISVAGSPVLLYFILHGGTYYDNLPGQVNLPPQ